MIERTTVAGRPAVITTNLSFLKPFKKGKVREVYETGDYLLIVATDRISAFDVIMRTPVPGKGVYLTAQSAFWFKELEQAGFHTHFVSDSLDDIVDITGETRLRQWTKELSGRIMLAKKADALPIEAVCRFRIFGSALAALKNDSWIWDPITLQGPLEPGVKVADAPVFTPTDKSETDEKITFEQMVTILDGNRELAEQVKQQTLDIFRFANDRAAAMGFEIADGKVEFGLIDGTLTLIDETFTSDSTRFIPDKSKEVFRQWLISHNLKGRSAVIPDAVAGDVADLYREQCTTMGLSVN